MIDDQAAASLPDDLATLGIGELLQVARSRLRMDVAFVGEFVGDRRVIRYSADPEGRLLPGAADDLDASYCHYIVSGEVPSIVRDTSEHALLARLAGTEALDVRAHLGVPIRRTDGSLYGTICCFKHEPDQSLGQRDEDVLSLLADLITLRLGAGERSRGADQETAAGLRRVIEERGPRVVFQPIVDLTTNKAVGYEALARFEEGTSPLPWFQDAARVGLLVELELAAVEAAIGGLARIPEPLFLSANLGPASLVSPRLRQILDAVAPSRLVLELTEHEPFVFGAMPDDALAWARSRGIRIAFDDVGAGYAGLTQLLQLKPDVVKLDAELVRGVDQDQTRQAMILAFVSFAERTGVAVIAEGIETAAELASLRLLGVGLGQGFYLGRPGDVPADP